MRYAFLVLYLAASSIAGSLSATAADECPQGCLACFKPLLSEQSLPQQEPPPGPGLFGISVAVGGNPPLVLVGAPGAGARDRGEVFLFDINGTQQKKSIAAPNDSQPGSLFGWSVAIDKNGTILAIGAPLDNTKGTSAGRVYVYEASGSGWTLEARLTGSDTTAFDAFGFSVALSDDGHTLVVGAPLHDLPDAHGNAGAVYVFKRGTGLWPAEESAKLIATDAEREDELGTSVAVDASGTLIAAGAPQPEAHVPGDEATGLPGKAYVFGPNETFRLDPNIAPGKGMPFGGFGFSVAIESDADLGDAVVVGAPGADEKGDRSGAVYLFERPKGGTWPATATAFSPCDGTERDEAGFAVAMDGKTIVVGARRVGEPNDHDERPGAVYTLQRDGGLGLTAKIPMKSLIFELGRTVAVHAGLLAAGAPLTDLGKENGNAGAAFLYPLRGLSAEGSVKGEIPGQVGTFTGTITNNSGTLVQDARVTLTFDPTRLSEVKVTCDPQNGASCRCLDGCKPDLGANTLVDQVSLPPGSKITYVLTANIRPDARNALVYKIRVDAPNGTADPISDNSAEGTMILKEMVDFEVTAKAEVKKPTDAPACGEEKAVAGQDQIVYTITVTNTGSSDAIKGVTIIDELPEDVEIVSKEPESGKVRMENNSLHWTLSRLPAHQSRKLTITVKVLSRAQETLINLAYVESEKDAAAETPTEVETVADLDVEASKASETAVAGSRLETLTTTLEVVNHGPSDAIGVVVTLTLPKDIGILPEGIKPAEQVPGTSFEDRVITWNVVGRLPASNGPKTLSIDLVIPASWVRENSSTTTPISATLPQQVQISKSEALDCQNNNDTDDLSTTVMAKASLKLTVTPPESSSTVAGCSQNEVVAGCPLTYKVKVENNGPSDATQVEVSGLLPEGFIFDEATGPGMFNNALWTVPLLEANQSLDLTIQGKVDPSRRDPLTSTIEARATAPQTSASKEFHQAVKAIVALKVEDATAIPSPAIAGAELVYSIIITNQGPSTAKNLKVRYELPDGVEFNDEPAEIDSGSCEAIGNILTCTVNNLAPPRSVTTNKVTAKVIVHVPHNYDRSKPLNSIFTIKSDEPQEPINHKISTQVIAVADLDIKLGGVEGMVSRGADVTYTLTVKNLGPSDITLAKIKDRFPKLLLHCTTADMPCDPLTDLVDVVSIPAMGVPYEAEATGTISSDPNLPGPLFNLASVTALDALDPDLSNNTSLLANPLAGDPTVSGAMAVSGHFVEGGEVVYRIALSNNGQTSVMDQPGHEFTDDLSGEKDRLKVTSAGASDGTVLVDFVNNIVHWDGGIPPAPAGVVQIVIFATILAGDNGAIENQGTFIFDNGTGQTHDPFRSGAATTTCFMLGGGECPTPQ